jgi:iduronate 2-sulfatase
MKSTNYFFAGLALSLTPFAVACETGKGEPPMNILFLSVDDLRPALACYGDPLAITPNIDALAAEGMLFSRHYVQSPSCGPSRTSMLTGLRPDQVRVTNHATHFRDTRPEVITLPQLFKHAGYTAISLGKIFHYSSGYNDSISWDKEYVFSGNYVLPENRNTRGKAASHECVDTPDNSYRDGMVTEKAIEYLKQFGENNTPFFLGVGFFKPHLPFSAPKKYWDLYDREIFRNIEDRETPVNAPEIAFHNWQELRGYSDIPEEGPLSAELETTLRHGYYACVSYIDAQIGMILKVLDDLSLRENTLIVFWGDHGFHLGEQNIWAKSTNFEMSARAPLIIATPGMGQRGVVCDALVESVDIYPTILELCGKHTSQYLAGKSLKPLIIDPMTKWSGMAFNQFTRPYQAAIGARIPMTHIGYSVRTELWRYTSWYNAEKGLFEFHELYAPETPGPTVNLAGKPEYREIQERLHQMVVDYQAGNYVHD